MDRLVTDAAEQLILIGVAEDLQGSGIEEGDPPRGVDNVQGVGDSRDSPKEHLRILRQLGSRDHAFIVARWPSDRPASPTPEGVQAAATPPTASRNVERMPTRRQELGAEDIDLRNRSFRATRCGPGLWPACSGTGCAQARSRTGRSSTRTSR